MLDEFFDILDVNKCGFVDAENLRTIDSQLASRLKEYCDLQPEELLAVMTNLNSEETDDEKNEVIKNEIKKFET